MSAREPCPIHKPCPCSETCPNNPEAYVQREIQRRLAEAWDEGRRFGQTHWASNYWPEVPHRPDVNPYRATSPSEGATS